MTVRLRPHHLLCMLTFVGKGYTPEFVANFEAVIRRILAGETVQIIEGPDDICAPLLSDAECHCLRPTVTRRDELAREALAGYLGQSLQYGALLALSPTVLDTMRIAFAAGNVRAACEGCSWRGLCDSIAEAKFDGTKLLG